MIFARRQDCPARGGRPGHWCRRGHPEARNGGWPGRWRVRGNGGAGSGPRRCVPTLRQRAKLPATYGETPATPATYGAAYARSFNTSLRLGRAHCTDPAQGRTARRAEGVPLKGVQIVVTIGHHAGAPCGPPMMLSPWGDGSANRRPNRPDLHG